MSRLTPEEEAWLAVAERRERLRLLEKRQRNYEASAELRRAVALGRTEAAGGPHRSSPGASGLFKRL